VKQLYILKAGTSFPEIVRHYGDFDDWTRAALGAIRVPVTVVDLQNEEPLPPPSQCAGVVVTGSHEMVTDRLPWSVRVEQWIPALLAAAVPFFGICYGHQLLAQAMGGTVAYHPSGIEAGSVGVRRLPEGADDVLFAALPDNFVAHVVHSQTVTALPPNAVRLAANAHEPNHAFRLGENAWGVQFHPEYRADIMRAYLLGCAGKLAQAGRSVPAMLLSVRPVTVASRLLADFGALVERAWQAGRC